MLDLWVNMEEPSLSRSAALPPELILEVVERLAPHNRRAILPSSHIITKTLQACALTCRATYPVASRLLRRYCMHIDSAEKAHRLARCLARPSALLSSAPPPERPASNLFLSPFEERSGQDKMPIGSNTGAESPLHDLPTVTAIRDILVAVAPTLRCLVIDMPLRSLYPEDDVQGVRPLLRQGFESLTNLEDFVSIQDELFLEVHATDRTELPVWATCWPKLRHLSLYNPVVDPGDEIWSHMARLSHLQMAIFARPDSCPGSEEDEQQYGENGLYSLNVKKEWLDALSATAQDGQLTRPRDISFVFVDVAESQPVFRKGVEQWSRIDPKRRVRVYLADAPLPAPKAHLFDINPIVCTHDYLRKHALGGTLWSPRAAKMYGAGYYIF